MKRTKKIFVSILIFFMLLNNIIVVSANNNSKNANVLTKEEVSQINNTSQSNEQGKSGTLEEIAELTVSLEDDNSSLDKQTEVSRDANLYYKIEFKIDNRYDWEYVKDKEFTYKLPNEYIIFPQMEDKIYLNDKAVANWKIENGELKLTFVDDSWYQINTDRKGSISINCRFNKSALLDKKEVEIEFPGTSTIIQFELESGDVQTNKYSETVVDEQGYQCLRYTIQVYNNGEDKDIKLCDKFSGDKDNIIWDSFTLSERWGEEEQIKIDDTAKTDKGFNYTIKNAESGKIYTIKYLVRVTEKDFDEYKCNLVNTVVTHWDNKESEPVKADTWLQKRPEITKKGEISSQEGNRYEFTWTIEINNPKLKGYSVAGKTLKDTISEENLEKFQQHYFEKATIKGLNGWTDEIELDDERNFEYTFPIDEEEDEKNIKFDPEDSFTITYKTYIETEGVYNGEVINEVSLDDYITESTKISIIGELDIVSGFDKEFIGFDIASHTLDWQMFIDIKDDYEIENLEITDNMNIIDEFGLLPDSIEVSLVDGTPLNKDEDYTIETGKNYLGEGINQIKIKFNDTINQDMYIKVKSKFEYISNDSHFRNEATLTYTYNGDKGIKTDVAIADIGDKYNITKWNNTTYNVEPNKIEWIITVNSLMTNYSEEEIIDVNVKDIIPEHTSFVDGSLSVKRISADNNQEDITENVKYEIKDGAIKFSNLGKIADINYQPRWEGEPNGYSYEIRYQTSFDPDFMYDNNSPLEIKNTAYLENEKQNVYSKAESTAWMKAVLLDKEDSNVSANHPFIKYTVKVNQLALDLDKNSEYIDLDDKLSESLSIILSSINVTGVDGKKLEDVKIAYDSNTRLLSIKVPDKTPCTISYEAEINGEVGQTYAIDNDIILRQNNAICSSISNSYYKYANNSSISGTPGKFSIQKIDASDITKKLKGATFKLYQIQYNDDKNDIDLKDEKLIDTVTTDDEGTAILPSRDVIQADWLYYFVETEAPDGYKLDENKHFIIREGENYNSLKSIMEDKYPDIKYELMPKDSILTFNISNHKIIKKFGSVELNISKSLNGERNKNIQNGEFNFKVIELEPIEGTEDFTKFNETEQEFIGKVEESSEKDSEGNYISNANINIEYDNVGTYWYKIFEMNTEDKNIIVDDSIYYAKVVVTENDLVEGELNTSIEYFDSEGNAIEQLEFTNQYTAKGKAIIEIEKELIGRKQELQEGEFQFGIYKIINGEEIPVKNNNGNDIVVSNTKEGKIFFNLDYTIDDIGTNQYVVRELDTTEQNITKDEEPINVIVEVSDKDGTGVLDSKVTINGTHTHFTNVYSSKGKFRFVGTKKLLGNREKSIQAGEFTFKVVDENEHIVATGETDDKGNIIFTEIEYTEKDIGEHIYTISENVGENDTIIYDTNTYKIKVMVQDSQNGDGTLEIKAEYPKNGVVFVNSYKEPEKQPEQAEPEQTKPEQTKPEQTKPEQTKPEQTEPEQTEPEQVEPEQAEPEQVKPEKQPEQVEPEKKPERVEPEKETERELAKVLPYTGNGKVTFSIILVLSVIVCIIIFLNRKNNQ